MSTNNPYAVVLSTGVIDRFGDASSEALSLQAGPGETTIIDALPEGVTDPSLVVSPFPFGLTDETHYWDGVAWQEYPSPPPGDVYWDGAAWQVRPAQPNPFTTWNGTAWVDPRSETDLFNQLHQARLATSIPTSELFIRLAQYGAFPMAEVANYAFPPTVDEFLDLPAFSTAQHDLIKGGLKSWATISRAETRLFGPIHPDDPGDGLPYFIPWLATEKSITITDAQADEMFGVDVPPPLYTAP